jgi:predicted GNAT superfamily acetyltransferase
LAARGRHLEILKSAGASLDNQARPFSFRDDTALGFTEVGSASIHNGSKTVRYLLRAL